MRRRLLLTQFESVKSTMRYSPPKGTAGLARSRVSGSRRVPLPPAKINVNTSITRMPPLRQNVECRMTKDERMSNHQSQRRERQWPEALSSLVIRATAHYFLI